MWMHLLRSGYPRIFLLQVDLCGINGAPWRSGRLPILVSILLIVLADFPRISTNCETKPQFESYRNCCGSDHSLCLGPKSKWYSLFFVSVIVPHYDCTKVARLLMNRLPFPPCTCHTSQYLYLPLVSPADPSMSVSPSYKEFTAIMRAGAPQPPALAPGSGSVTPRRTDTHSEHESPSRVVRIRCTLHFVLSLVVMMCLWLLFR